MPTTVGSGIGSSIGFGSESTWATVVTPVKWLEHESETLEWKPKRIRGKGLGAGNLVQRNATEQQVTSTVEGDMKIPVYYKGNGLLFGSIMGSMTSAPVQQGSTAAYLQTHALAASYGQSLTIQKGVPDVTGLIHQYTFNGCKVEQMTLECAVDGFLLGTYLVDGHGYDTSTAYTTASYQSGNTIFAFEQGFISVGAYLNDVGVEGVRKYTVQMKRPYKKDNFYLDGTGLKQQQVQNGFFEIIVDLETDYISDAAWVAQFNADTAQSLTMTFAGSQIAAGAGGAKTISAVSAASTGAIVTATAHGFTAGQQVVISGVTNTGTGNVNNAGAASNPNAANPSVWVIDTVTTNTFRIPYNSNGFVYTSGGTATQNYYYLMQVQIPNLRWNMEPPKIAGPDEIQPKMQLVGLFDDTHTAATLIYQSTDTAL